MTDGSISSRLERTEALCACAKSVSDRVHPSSDRVCSRSDRVRSGRDRMESGMDLGAIEYGRMEIGLIWTSARVGIVLIE